MKPTIIARMRPQDEARYAEQLANAPIPVLYLARTLQRAAFPDRDFDGGFKPAPLYIQQATAFAKSWPPLDRLAEAVCEVLEMPTPLYGGKSKPSVDETNV